MSAAETIRKRRPASGAVTLGDVARAAGVSPATVSRVLNGRARVGEVMRVSVEEAARRLGYTPHAAARALASRRSRIVGAVVPTLENPSFARGVEALQRRLAEHGFTLLLSSCGYSPARELEQVRALAAHGVDGLMLVGAVHDPRLYPFLREKNIAFVNGWVASDDPSVASVGFDNVDAGYRVARYLLELGHREIGVIAGTGASNDRARDRVAGIRRAMAEHGLALPRERLLECPYSIVDGQAALRALLAGAPRPTAVICGNDLLAFGALIECQNTGVAVPEALSLVGYDDLDFAARLKPSLTTVRVPVEEIGSRAADYLLAVMAGEAAPPAIEVELSLIVRDSTAPPPSPYRPSSSQPVAEGTDPS